jgi:hypothetical protein
MNRIARTLSTTALVTLLAACSSSSGSSGGGSGTSGPPDAAPAPVTQVFVEGDLASATDAQATHDQIFGAKLFAGQPKLTVATARDGWYGWGTFSRTLTDGRPAVVAVIRGTLAPDPQTAMGIHNDGSKKAEPAVTGAGDIAHVVYLDAQDPKAFLVTDVWTNADGAKAAYGSPDFAAGFSALLVGAPTITIYVDTTWVQW